STSPKRFKPEAASARQATEQRPMYPQFANRPMVEGDEIADPITAHPKNDGDNAQKHQERNRNGE
ncbi:MAG TPA: hypothetical protein VFC46_11055, partial [Humisphaera sp.]|nr:hypothetical protein [Humisphaera sp.]